MAKIASDDHVLPRPVERMPDYANAKARQSLAERLTQAFGLTASSAETIADAIVDPSEVRRSIGEPTDPDVERIPVPGGTLLGIRTQVWARRIMPDPRNPRTLPSRKHPFAVDPGSGDEDSRFRPVPEPQPLDRARPQSAELVVEIESRHQLAWAAQQTAAYVLNDNDWRTSIKSQGVMEAVWLVATTFRHADGSDPATTLTTAEGSSRATAVHNLLEVVSADVPYDDNDAGMRARVKRLNEAYDRGERDPATIVALRCERMPALILVGFEPYPGGTTGFPTAVRSFVALRHVDPPKPWGEGPENEALADEVLDELLRRGLVTATEREYYAGSCTRGEARAARLPDDPVLRAAQLVHLFTAGDEEVYEAIRVAVTSQSTRKRMTQKLMNDLATALILRAVSGDRGDVDQIRRYLRHAFGKAAHRRGAWKATSRSTADLTKAALKEVAAAIASDNDEPGPASVELAVRAAFPLVVDGRLNADRGTSGNDQPDRRTPGEVLDAMRRKPQGIRQLSQALRDYSEGVSIRAVDDDGAIRMLEDGSEEQVLSDVWLRNEFPPAGKAKAARPGDSPTDRYDRAVEALGGAMQELSRCFDALSHVAGDDGTPLVERRGVEVRLTDPWRDAIRSVDEELLLWSRAYRKRHGQSRPVVVGLGNADDDTRDEVEEEWDANEGAETGEDSEAA